MKLMKTPRELDIEITGKCNLRCEYCSHFDSPGDVDRDLPFTEWQKFFNELRECQVLSVCLQGGEPFVRKDILKIIQSLTQNNIRYSILSNGSLITDDIARFIHASKRCSGIQISLDGSESSVHDQCRGQGAFAGAIQGIEILKKYRVPVNVRVTLQKHNLHDLENTAGLILKDLNLKFFSVNSVGYLGMCRQNQSQLELNTTDRIIAMETLLSLSQQYPGRILASAGPMADARLWKKMSLACQANHPPFKEGGFLNGCHCVENSMAVRADGMLVPCNQMSHLELGMINQVNLGEVWRNHSELERLRNRKTIPLQNFEFCADCEFIDYCTGNCPATAYTILGNDCHPSPDSCFRQFLKSGGRLPEEKYYHTTYKNMELP
jgi:SynChlorMet cassette radical SAM/SPASM protein ScmE